MALGNILRNFHHRIRILYIATTSDLVTMDHKSRYGSLTSPWMQKRWEAPCLGKVLTRDIKDAFTDKLKKTKMKTEKNLNQIKNGIVHIALQT